MTARDFLKDVSPNDEIGIRADLKTAKIEKHIINIMELYTDLRMKEQLIHQGQNQGQFVPETKLYNKI